MLRDVPLSERKAALEDSDYSSSGGDIEMSQDSDDLDFLEESISDEEDDISEDDASSDRTEPGCRTQEEGVYGSSEARMARVRTALKKHSILPPTQHEYEPPEATPPPTRFEPPPMAGLRSALSQQSAPPPHYTPPKWYF
jgi:hypothetical protein